VIKRILVQILQSIGLDKWVEEHKVTPAIGNKKVSGIVGSLAKWYVILIGVTIAMETVSLLSFSTPWGVIQAKPLSGLNEFLWGIVNYVPKAIIAILFFVAALLFAKYIANQILLLKHKLKNIAAFLVQAVIVLFALVISLQILLGPEIGQTLVQLLQIFLQPFIWSLAIVLGIVGGFAVGLAFKEEIKGFAKEMKKEYGGSLK